MDVIHSPSFLAPLAPTRARHVLTVHDMTSFTHPELQSRLHRSAGFRRAVQWSARRAHRISVPSQSTAGELQRLFGIDGDRVVVIAPGVAEGFRPRSTAEVRPVLERLGVRAPYVLAVGSLGARKNGLGLLEAFSHLDEPEHLVLTGRESPASAPALARAARHDLRDRVRVVGYVDAADLPALYAGARLLAHPSLAEGFGFPPLEAMASGVPVLAGDNSSMTENLAGAALLVDARDRESLAEGLRRGLRDEPLRQRLINAGLARAARFAWEHMGRETAAVYRELGAQ